MFSYVDPHVYERLVQAGKIAVLDVNGQAAAQQQDERIVLLGPIPIPRVVGGVERSFCWYPFVRRTQHEQVLEIGRRLKGNTDFHELWELLTAQMTVNSILTYGPFVGTEAPLVRVHSCCITGETFGSQRCECGPQLDRAFNRIVDEGCGAIVYMANHEGRGIGLWAKGITYLLQDMGYDTYDANRELGLPEDSRDFHDAAIVLRHFLAPPPTVRLLSNNPLKQQHLAEGGVAVIDVERLVVGVSRHNLRYMRAKRSHGHSVGTLPDDES